MNPIELGKFLASLRNEKNLTQEELADKLFIDKRKISRWECGTSTPEFDMLIKLSEILDVSLYELSICKRLEKEKLSRKVINKFKSIKDFKKYKLKKKLLIVFYMLLIIVFGITLTYTIRNQGSVQIYELKSLDDNYSIKGNYIKYKDKNTLILFSIIDNDKNENYMQKDCSIEIYDSIHRISNSYDKNYFSNYNNNYLTINSKKSINNNFSNSFKLKMICDQRNITLNFKFKKIFSNSLFSFY